MGRHRAGNSSMRAPGPRARTTFVLGIAFILERLDESILGAVLHPFGQSSACLSLTAGDPDPLQSPGAGESHPFQAEFRLVRARPYVHASFALRTYMVLIDYLHANNQT